LKPGRLSPPELTEVVVDVAPGEPAPGMAGKLPERRMERKTGSPGTIHEAVDGGRECRAFGVPFRAIAAGEKLGHRRDAFRPGREVHDHVLEDGITERRSFQRRLERPGRHSQGVVDVRQHFRRGEFSPAGTGIRPEPGQAFDQSLPIGRIPQTLHGGEIVRRGAPGARPRRMLGPKEDTMSSVARVTEISARSEKSFEEAIRNGISRASKTLRNVTSAWVKEQRLDVAKGKIKEYQVNLLVTFVLED